MKSTTILLATILMFGACKSTTTKEITEIENTAETIVSTIQPMKGLEVPVATYDIIAESGGEINLPNGGKITIREGSFVDKNGNDIKGKVDVNWQEFHSLTDVMLSGIPMKYDSAGVEENFVSGGMFTINANQNGNEVFIKEGKKVDVDLVSIDDTPCFNFYELNEKTGKWKYDTTAVAEPIVKKETKKKEVQRFEKTLIDCEVEYSQFQELLDKNIVAWQAKDKLSRAEQNYVKGVVSKLTLQKDAGGYFLNFKRGKKVTKINVEPFTMEAAQTESVEIKEELEVDFAEIRSTFQNMNIARNVRSISLENFGTFNWDCIHRKTDIQMIAAQFEYDGVIEKPSTMALYYLCEEDNLIINCSPLKQPNFFYSPNKNNVLVAISKDHEVFTIDDSAFDELRQNRGKKSHTFILESTGLIAESGEEVGEIVRNVF